MEILYWVEEIQCLKIQNKDYKSKLKHWHHQQWSQKLMLLQKENLVFGLEVQLLLLFQDLNQCGLLKNKLKKVEEVIQLFIKNVFKIIKYFNLI